MTLDLGFDVGEAAGEHGVYHHDAAAGQGEEQELAVAVYLSQRVPEHLTHKGVSWYSENNWDEDIHLRNSLPDNPSVEEVADRF